jgi:hypothetical protein
LQPPVLDWIHKRFWEAEPVNIGNRPPPIHKQTPSSVQQLKLEIYQGLLTFVV